eukprot:CAMPEP_0113699054 /NCGR_PEP_ID=MMETSP0038_2-20120614/23077_1 /TAXON_ID=2898 /ORGANISM="Cryptomonas paramecium" /LENGTH=113 /DNA_ID=CAMNT_0000622335 /DNA_START=100 /DNA_END=438 /DNA_ORIENTATION=+ /assembly_acc=CAM_ASM_000170
MKKSGIDSLSMSANRGELDRQIADLRAGLDSLKIRDSVASGKNTSTSTSSATALSSSVVRGYRRPPTVRKGKPFIEPEDEQEQLKLMEKARWERLSKPAVRHLPDSINYHGRW